MTEFKGTPGPWELGTPEQQGQGMHVPIHGVGHGELAMVVWQMADDKFDRIRSISCEANALLIAAAPELLAALIEAENLMRGIGVQGRSPTAVVKADQMAKVIAKALGEKP